MKLVVSMKSARGVLVLLLFMLAHDGSAATLIYEGVSRGVSAKVEGELGDICSQDGQLNVGTAAWISDLREQDCIGIGSASASQSSSELLGTGFTISGGVAANIDQDLHYSQASSGSEVIFTVYVPATIAVTYEISKNGEAQGSIIYEEYDLRLGAVGPVIGNVIAGEVTQFALAANTQYRLHRFLDSLNFSSTVPGASATYITTVMVVPEPGVCGGGLIESPETCDDGGTTSGDGCDATCQVETGWICQGEPSTCTLTPPPVPSLGPLGITMLSSLLGLFGVSVLREHRACSTSRCG
jgi:cysteine-rich repeat protein